MESELGVSNSSINLRKKVQPLEGSFKLPLQKPPALVSRLPSFGSWRSAGGGGRSEKERNENSRIRRALAAVSMLAAGRSSLSGGRGGGRLPGSPGQPGAKTERRGGLEKGIVPVCLGGGVTKEKNRRS